MYEVLHELLYICHQNHPSEKVHEFSIHTKFKNDEIEAYRSMAMPQVDLFNKDKTEIHTLLPDTNTHSFNDWAPLTSRHTIGF